MSPSLLLIQDLEATEVPLLPALMISRAECECCGRPAHSIALLWLFWGIGLGIHFD